MRYSIQHYASALYQALEETAPANQDNVIDRFVEILKKNNDLSYYEAIVAEYEKISKEARGISEAEVTLARDVKVNSDIIDSLNKVVSGQVEIKTQIDESIIGGVIVRVDDTLIDASIRGQLDKLKKGLAS